ncbi:MAG TPA: Hsp70 family protein, partial [Gammaproteobacteria bacterium]|nr:Hsp70 family protein [Gammaproteobacteria bacterium]
KDKIDAETRGKIESALEDLKKAIEGDDAEAIKAKTEALAQASHKLAEAMYAQAQQEGGEGGQEGEATTGGEKEDVVEAEFEEVDEDKK